MTKEEAIATLRGYNEWRRYDGPVGEGPTQPEPKTIGEAIDTICDALERLENVPFDLDEAAEEWCKANHKGIALSADKKSHYLAEGVDAFKAGTEWQKKQDDRLVDIIYQQGIEKGKDEIRETLKRKEKK